MSNQFNDEIDLIGILKKIYISRKTILYTSSLFLLMGIVYSMLLPIKFNSSTVFIPQNQESNTSSLSGVASLVGINFGSTSNGGDIPPAMYPQIGNSPKFKRLILDKIIDKKNNLTLKKYLIKQYNIENNDNEIVNSPLFMSKTEETCFKILNDIISINVNQKDGFVTINSTMPVAEYSAIIANKAKEILQKIIIENKIETARQNLNFSKKQLADKKLEFDEIQSKLAYFSDSNLNAVNTFVINEKDKLDAEFQIISAVVTELAKQVETAKLQVTKDTPVFSTVKEAIVPLKKSSPMRTQIVFYFVFTGFLLSCLFVVLKSSTIDIFKKISQ